ncbi:hypothetical protein Hanom_Chr05g00445681 [Helianthus anomalus]
MTNFELSIYGEDRSLEAMNQGIVESGTTMFKRWFLVLQVLGMI